ncbi:sulfatase family protein [Sphingomonas sp.]|jgi:arylsulfatase A-like enzyme|uniref:sulfatase family protein n=1 Tax=Sphingomonas sp. TaxID=28214 RepID=UPI002E0D5C9C|nr:sulfatase-like hydrolase/transferase [Sphingomonas sp.]HEV7289942.1 sulfatase-like hydrolase/transferase [Sphingomonas sp.]
MKTLTKLLVAASMFGIAGCAAAPVLPVVPMSAGQAPQEKKKPNLIVILVDDLPWTDVSINKASTVSTPNIDRIGEQGVNFTAGYVAASVCAVSRAALLTGRTPARYGFMYNINDRGNLDAGAGLPTDVPTIAEHLKPMGYRTAVFGKWHQGADPKFYPTRRGFDEFFGFLAGETIYADPDTPGLVTTPTKADRYEPKAREGGGRLFEGPEMRIVEQPNQYLTETITERSVDFIRRSAASGEPFFGYVAYNAPHWPLQVPKPYYDRRSEIADPVRRTYVAMVDALDVGVGQILKALSDTGVRDDTIVIFLSDNGCPVQFGFCPESHPWGAGKFTYLEGGTRVPFLMSWPNGLKHRGTIAAPVSSMDILPTILRAVAPDQPLDKELEGQDLVATVAKPATAERTLIWSQRPVRAIREGRYKLWHSDDWAQTRLYDIEADPWETNDLSAAMPDRVRAMKDKVDRFDASLPKPLWPLKSTREMIIGGRKTEFVY